MAYLESSSHTLQLAVFKTDVQAYSVKPLQHLLPVCARVCGNGRQSTVDASRSRSQAHCGSRMALGSMFVDFDGPLTVIEARLAEGKSLVCAETETEPYESTAASTQTTETVSTGVSHRPCRTARSIAWH
jgi:hypothetical protein